MRLSRDLKVDLLRLLVQGLLLAISNSAVSYFQIYTGEKKIFVALSSNITLKCTMVHNEIGAILRWEYPETITLYGHYFDSYVLPGDLRTSENKNGSYTTELGLTLLSYFNAMDGNYTCKYENGKTPHAIKTELVMVRVTRSKPLSHPTKQKSVSLYCTPQKKLKDVEPIRDRPDFLWQRNGVELRENEIYSINSTDGTLTINNPDKLGGGCFLFMYPLKLTSGDLATFRCAVDISAAPTAVAVNAKIVQGPWNDIQIDCAVKGCPIPEVTWFQGTKKLDDFDRIRFHMYMGVEKARLTISTLKVSDAGNYKCQASTQGYQKSADAFTNLVIEDNQEEGTGLVIESGEDQIYVAAGSTTTLSCILTHRNETVNLLWGSPDSRTGLFTEYRSRSITAWEQTSNDNGDGTYTITRDITFDNFNIGYNGACVCRYTHMGKIHSTGVMLELLPVLETFGLNLESAPGKDPASLFCKPYKAIGTVYGFGYDVKHDYQWQRYEENITEGEKHSINRKDGTLKISKAAPGDAGCYNFNYALKLRNNQKGRFTCEVEVEESPRVDVEDTKIGLLGETAQLDCYVIGCPLPKVTWYKEGEKVVANERITFEKYKGFYRARLVISDLMVEDDGSYECDASNDKKTAKASIRLIVAGPYGIYSWEYILWMLLLTALSLIFCLFFIYKRKHIRQSVGGPYEPATSLVVSEVKLEANDATSEHFSVARSSKGPPSEKGSEKTAKSHITSTKEPSLLPTSSIV